MCYLCLRADLPPQFTTGFEDEIGAQMRGPKTVPGLKLIDSSTAVGSTSTSTLPYFAYVPRCDFKVEIPKRFGQNQACLQICHCSLLVSAH